MLKPGTTEILHTYCRKYPAIAEIELPLKTCIQLLADCFKRGGQLLVCGNGGSCADADHIVGELVKAFRMKRPLSESLVMALREQGEKGEDLAKTLQGGFPAINLGAHSALMTAVLNDMSGEYVYAQQVVAYGRTGDILLGISTSGNSENILHAGLVAKVKGMKTIGLTGKSGGKMNDQFDLVLRADANTTEDIQDIHTIIYHTICACVEYQFWGD